MTADERLLALETAFHQHQVDDAKLMTQIPLQLDSIKEMITALREDVKGVRNTQERHSSRIMSLEQAPLKAATDELAARKAGENKFRETVGGKFLDLLIKAVVLVVTMVGAVLATAWTGLLQAVSQIPPSPPPVP